MNIDQALIALCEKHDVFSLDVGVTTSPVTGRRWFTAYAHYTGAAKQGVGAVKQGTGPTASEAIAHAIQQVNEARACVVEVPAMELEVGA